MMQQLLHTLPHLTEGQMLSLLIMVSRELFSDIPSQTHLFGHDIVVAGLAPIKHAPYWASPEKESGQVYVAG